MNLRDYSTEEMEAEILRRRRLESDPKPVPLDSPDFSRLVTACSEYLDQIEKYRYSDDDSEHYIYELAMAAIFGPDVWKWINSHLE